MESNENPPDRSKAVADPSEAADQQSEPSATTKVTPRHWQIAAGIGSAAIVAALLFVNRPKAKRTSSQGKQAPPETD